MNDSINIENIQIETEPRTYGKFKNNQVLIPYVNPRLSLGMSRQTFEDFPNLSYAQKIPYFNACVERLFQSIKDEDMTCYIEGNLVIKPFDASSITLLFIINPFSAIIQKKIVGQIIDCSLVYIDRHLKNIPQNEKEFGQQFVKYFPVVKEFSTNQKFSLSSGSGKNGNITFFILPQNHWQNDGISYSFNSQVVTLQ